MYKKTKCFNRGTEVVSDLNSTAKKIKCGIEQSTQSRISFIISKS